MFYFWTDQEVFWVLGLSTLQGDTTVLKRLRHVRETYGRWKSADPSYCSCTIGFGTFFSQWLSPGDCKLSCCFYGTSWSEPCLWNLTRVWESSFRWLCLHQEFILIPAINLSVFVWKTVGNIQSCILQCKKLKVEENMVWKFKRRKLQNLRYLLQTARRILY